MAGKSGVWLDIFFSAVILSGMVVSLGAMASYLGRRASSWLNGMLDRVNVLGGTDRLALTGLVMCTVLLALPAYFLLRCGEALSPVEQEGESSATAAVPSPNAREAAAEATSESRNAPFDGWYPDPIAVS